MRAAFFGTPAAAIPILAALAEVAAVELVVTRPDKPKGRSARPQPPAIKQAAEQFGFRLLQPKKAEESSDRLEGFDVAVVAAYGQILPASLLEVPAAGFVNVHYSILPRWRGAAPVARAIEAGDQRTGVSLMLVDAGLDTGPVFAMAETRIEPEDSTGSLTARLSAIGARLLTENLEDYVRGELVPIPQDGDAAVPAPKVDPSQARLRPALTVDQAARMVRAFNPAPGAWFETGGLRVKVWRASVAAARTAAAGQAVVTPSEVLLGFSDGTLELLEVQPAGKKRMAAADWARGTRGSFNEFR